MRDKYKHLFFDLDRTLWDFEKSARQTFEEIFTTYKLEQKGIPDYESFTKVYKKHNDKLWALYREGEIKKEVLSVKRFELTLQDFGINDHKLAEQIAKHYVSASPLKVNLFPFTHEILSYLGPNYQLHLITNGFEEVQEKKLDSGDLRKYFKGIITSEEAGVKKPENGIFHYALKKVNADIEESLMIGDDLDVDIAGAKDFGMDQMFVNHDKVDHGETVTFEVFSLEEIKEVL